MNLKTFLVVNKSVIFFWEFSLQKRNPSKVEIFTIKKEQNFMGGIYMLGLFLLRLTGSRKQQISTN